MKITVNKCPYTGELFESDKKYASHMSAMRRQRAADRAEKKKHDDFENWLAIEKEKIIHVEMIAPWILENQRDLMDFRNAGITPIFGFSNFDRRQFYRTDEFIKLELISLRYSHSVSNSHSCPYNGTTNWGGRNKDAPRGYPGWTGRVNGNCKRASNHSHKYPFSDILNIVGVHTGTGGGGNDDWGYHVDIFLADWPGLSQQLMFEKLKGEK